MHSALGKSEMDEPPRLAQSLESMEDMINGTTTEILILLIVDSLYTNSD